MAHHLIFLQAYSPLHAGTGQGLGVIDLPIAREKATNLPYLPGSSLKGALRARCSDLGVRKGLFGPDTQNASEHAGAVQFSDQRLLLLPVRSMSGTFAYVTSHWVLRRFARDVEAVGDRPPESFKAPTGKDVLVAPDSTLALDGQVVLEDLDFQAVPKPDIASLGTWLASALGIKDAGDREAFVSRIAVIPDDSFNYLSEQGTEVVARIRLEEASKSVADGGLWYEESLPTESVLYGVAITESVRQGGKQAPLLRAEDAAAQLRVLLEEPGLMQLGGKATVGRGLCKLVLKEG